MASQMLLDNKTARACAHLRPHVNGFSMDEPFKVSNRVWIPKPVISTVSNWIHDKKHDVEDPVKRERMKTLFKH